MISDPGPGWDPDLPLWVLRPVLRPLAQRLAAAQLWTLPALEQPAPAAVVRARDAVERQIRAVMAAGWQPPATSTTAGTVNDLEALPPGTVVTDPDGHPWIRNRVGE